MAKPKKQPIKQTSKSRKAEPVKPAQAPTPAPVPTPEKPVETSIGAWGPDLIAENILQSQDIPFEVRRVALIKIDFKGSADNRGRMADKLDPDVVLKYGSDMLDGLVMPRMVLNERSDGSYRVISGMHRGYGAMEAGFKEVEAYVVSITDKMTIDKIPILFNVDHGVGIPREHKLEQARFMIQKHSMTVRQAAKIYKLSEAAIRKDMQRSAVLHDLRAMKIDGSGLNNTLLDALHAVENRNVLLNLGEILTTFKLHTKDAEDHIDRIAKAAKKGETDGIRLVNEWRAQLARARKDRPAKERRGVYDQLLRRLKDVIGMVERYKDADGLQISTPEARAEIHGKVAEIVKHFRGILIEDAEDAKSDA